MNKQKFNLSSYDFKIPKELIAQEPTWPRDGCRLLILDRKNKAIKEGTFGDIISYFKKGDVLVLNNTKVIKARLEAQKETGAKLEILLLREVKERCWEVLIKPSRRVRLGDIILFKDQAAKAKIINKTAQGLKNIEFISEDFNKFLQREGKVPLPPYIKKETKEFGYYQTVYAKEKGAVAAPTAGLHFTSGLIKKIEDKGVKVVYVTLHCGLATFRPVKASDIRHHIIESEWIEVLPKTAKIINSAKANGKKVIAVGTTAIRTLESVASPGKDCKYRVRSFSGLTNLYIVPGYKFKIVDSVITNFHTPASTNLILVSAFAGFAFTNQSYCHAAGKNFKFYSLGDATLIV